MQTLTFRTDKQPGPTIQHRDCIRSPIEDHDGKEYEKEYAYVYNHFVIQQIQHNIVNQLCLIKKKRKNKSIILCGWELVEVGWTTEGMDGWCGRKWREPIKAVVIEPVHGLRHHLLRLERTEIKKSVHEPKCCGKFCDVCRANTDDVTSTCMDKQM